MVGGAQEPGWSALLREARTTLGLSQAGLAARAGVSKDAVVSYEGGRRRPARPRLLQLTRAMELDGATTNAILADAGFGLEPSEFARFIAGEGPAGSQHYAGRAPVHHSVATIQGSIGPYAWPCLIVDERCRIVASNEPAGQVFGAGVRPGRRAQGQQTLVGWALSAETRAHVVNWGDLATVVAPRALRKVVATEGRSPPPARLREVVADLAVQSPEVLGELQELWTESEPPTLTSRVSTPVVWRAGDGAVLAFNLVISSYNTADPYWALEWHPANAETWDWLEARRNRRRPSGRL